MSLIRAQGEERDDYNGNPGNAQSEHPDNVALAPAGATDQQKSPPASTMHNIGDYRLLGGTKRQRVPYSRGEVR